MTDLNIISEKKYGQYSYSNDTVNVSGNYIKNSLEDSILSLSGTCYSVDGENIFYGSFNHRLTDESGETKMDRTTYATKPEYKEIIQAVADQIEQQL